MVGHGLAQGEVSRQALTSPRGPTRTAARLRGVPFHRLMNRAFVTATLLIVFIVQVAHPAPAQAMAGLRAVTCCARGCDHARSFSDARGMKIALAVAVMATAPCSLRRCSWRSVRRWSRWDSPGRQHGRHPFLTDQGRPPPLVSLLLMRGDRAVRGPHGKCAPKARSSPVRTLLAGCRGDGSFITSRRRHGLQRTAVDDPPATAQADRKDVRRQCNPKRQAG